MKLEKVTVLIPCYNEADAIGEVIDSFPRRALQEYGFSLSIIVIDNNSTDNTREVALTHGAEVICELRKGKGNAIKCGFSNVPEDSDYVVMLDGDNTYRPEEVLRLLFMLKSDFCNVVAGSRLRGKIADGSMNRLNRIGNQVFTFLVQRLYGMPITDVLTGYYAWKRSVIDILRPHLHSEGFTIEMEMVTKLARIGEQIYSVPISYHARAGESNLKPFSDGIQILKVLIRNLFWRRADIENLMLRPDEKLAGSTLML